MAHQGRPLAQLEALEEEARGHGAPDDRVRDPVRQTRTEPGPGANDVLGRTITLDEAPHVIVGVLPPRSDAFTGNRPEVFLPLSLAPGPQGGLGMVFVLGLVAYSWFFNLYK